MSEPSPTVWGPVCVARGRHELEVDGRTVRVEPRVMEVLCVLLEAGGDVVSRTTLLGAVWHDKPVSDEALTQSVSALRKALGPHRRLIVTVPKRGYRAVCIPQTQVPAPKNAQLSGGLEAARPGFRSWSPQVDRLNHRIAGGIETMATAMSRALGHAPWLRNQRVWAGLITAAVSVVWIAAGAVSTRVDNPNPEWNPPDVIDPDW